MLNIEPNNGNNGNHASQVSGALGEERISPVLGFPDYPPISFSRREQIERILSGKPLAPAIQQRIEKNFGGTQMTCIYPGTLDQVVTGCDLFNFPKHDDVHRGALLCKEVAAFSLAELENSKVDGFRDGKNYVVRIEDHKPLLDQVAKEKDLKDSPARLELNKLLAKYARAIELAGVAVQVTEGSVFLEAEGVQQITIAKMLGRLHQASAQNDISGKRYLARARVENMAGEFYYSRTGGTRYKTPDQLEAMKRNINDPENFIKGLMQMHTWMTTNNRHGAREARFLIVDPATGQAVSKGPAIDRMISHLEDLIETCRTVRNNWKENVELIGNQLSHLAAAQRAMTHADFQHDDTSNATFVQILSGVLKRGGTGVMLGSDFSTPQEALEIGFYHVNRDNERVFVHSASESEHERLISWVQANFPETENADWLCLCRPRIPLTSDHHPSSFVSAFGDSEYQSYVVLIGRLGEPETRLVIRRNSYAEGSWELRNTTRVSQLLEERTPEYLTSAVRHFQRQQYNLAKALGRLAGSTHSIEADMFEPIDVDPAHYRFGDFEIRPFYNGKRVDLESPLTMWPLERIQGALTCVGEIIAKNIVKQAPDLSISGLVITSETEKTQVPLTMMKLSESETFCHSLGIKSTRNFLATVPILYGAHIAAWVESYCQGEHCRGLGLSSHAINKVRTELIKICISNFDRTFRAITGSGNEEFREELARVRETYDAYGSVLPPELDMRRSLDLTKSIASITASQLRTVESSIRQQASYFCKIYAKAVKGSESENSDAELRGKVIDATYSLINNHFSHRDRFISIVKILNRDDGAAGGAPYSLQEKLWLYTIIDVGAWLSEIKMGSKSEELLDAAKHSDVDSFIMNRKLLSGLNLSRQTLARFHEAIEGLRAENKRLGEQDPTNPKRAQLLDDINHAYALRKLRGKL